MEEISLISQYEIKTYEKIKKIATGQGDDYTTRCLVDSSAL